MEGEMRMIRVFTVPFVTVKPCNYHAAGRWNTEGIFAYRCNVLLSIAHSVLYSSYCAVVRDTTLSRNRTQFTYFTCQNLFVCLPMLDIQWRPDPSLISPFSLKTYWVDVTSSFVKLENLYIHMWTHFCINIFFKLFLTNLRWIFPRIHRLQWWAGYYLSHGTLHLHWYGLPSLTIMKYPIVKRDHASYNRTIKRYFQLSACLPTPKKMENSIALPAVAQKTSLAGESCTGHMTSPNPHSQCPSASHYLLKGNLKPSSTSSPVFFSNRISCA